MKKTTLFTATAALLATGSHLCADAGITYALPGMDGQSTMTGMNSDETLNLGKYFEYEIHGIEYQLGSGDPGNGWNNGNGDFNGSKTGKATLTISVNGTEIASNITLNTNNIGTTESASITFEEPLVIKNSNVSVRIDYETDMTGASATFASVKGTCLKDPPTPSGDLSVASIVRAVNEEDGEGVTPTVSWAISREGVYGTTPAISVEGPKIKDKLAEKLEFDSDPTSPEESVDAPNAGEGKTNNGHGNNYDGVDVSNPGKSAEKWAARGIIDESGAFDDEIKPYNNSN